MIIKLLLSQIIIIKHNILIMQGTKTYQTVQLLYVFLQGPSDRSHHLMKSEEMVFYS